MISMNVLEPICSPCGDRQHALITSTPPSLFLLAGLEWGGGEGVGGLFKFPVCPMRVGAVCPPNLCSKNVTFDSCAALSHPVARIQCGPVRRGSAEEVSVITTACTTFCTSLPTPLTPILTSPPLHNPLHPLKDPQLAAATFQALLLQTTAHIKLFKTNYL